MEELRLIEEIRKRAGSPGKGVRAGIGDDCAVLDYDSKKYLLWAADMLVEGTHFSVKEAGYRKIGRKAVAVNISDIAAMGGVPAYITVAAGIPPRMDRTAVRAVYDGIFGMCKDHGIRVIGGDTNRSDSLVISVSIIGFVEKKRLLRRNGAKEGDLILVTGLVRDGRRDHLDFVPRLKEARFLSARYSIHSMIDVSDGIAPDLGRICAESGLGCKVYAGSIPLSRRLTLEDALYYGESFELLF
ncbi:MAG: thiamine-monophosphate kinase, partial [Candidatus Omnitrophica bacterium]|nr:thiamine-monophosphate kinase [Candidatus Omnitrophota bacterium]